MSEAGCLPFKLLLTQRLAQLTTRLTEKDPNIADLPVTRRVNDILLECTDTELPKICNVQRKTDREWYISKPQICHELKENIKAGTSSTIVRPMFQSLISNHYPNHKQIYTDGSKDGDEVGAGITDTHEKRCFSLPNYCSVYSAEAFAIKAAVTMVHEQEEAIILTDSASCLDALLSGKSKHPWIQSIERDLLKRKITLCWIPGHAGIPGNEEADFLANQGRKCTVLNIPVPSVDVIRGIKTKIWTTWEQTWHRTQAELRKIKEKPYKFNDRKCASEQRTLTRLRTGHTRPTHVHLIEKAPPPTCQYCGVQLTVQHILIDCRGLEEKRKKYGINGTLTEILANDDAKEKAVLE
ncbi:uncharacterized protein LOC129716789 [Wyeomyia smithii]|uniref:uncharacterized protein LOC129716789 n=1 Tax=Wyeomyia smithii TaxID=174621 RepID=UPI002467EA26|nr:uncharacterized protein LOC129716789 [Wyeomyia smithii]